MAFGGLTRTDVKIVEFAGYGAMWKGMVNNDVDAAFASTLTAPAKEVETSPRGILWPPLHHADKAGWERVQRVGPYFTPIKATCGAGIAPASPIELGSYPYPIFTTYASQPQELIYGVTKAMITDFDAYKDGAPGAVGLDVKAQTLRWVLPIHPAAVKAIKESGHWNEGDETHNQGLLKRQAVLAAAWGEFLKTNPNEDKDQFRAAWMSARRAALTQAGLPVGVDE
jgi:TRAP transporter TAXI family solute receptor